ncbi:MAG: hypothetical protein JOY69_06275 [Candidatus Eremiobacteraeota bacterium]|nr:hypothetical protein [Candidatus Eremiobacteraeota bacterium]
MLRKFSWSSVLAFVFAVCLGAVVGGVAVAQNQNHMYNARNDLQAARYQLQSAIHDKGGHRAAALNLVNQAIQQVNWGIQYGAY